MRLPPCEIRQQGIPPIPMPSGGQWLGQPLAPVIAAEKSARDLASRRRADQATAQGGLAVST